VFRPGQKRWRTASGDDEAEECLRRELGCTPLAARLLVNRGLSDPRMAEDFLAADYSRLPDPLLLPDAEVAVERLKQAIARKEKIWIHGDYDGDGVTSAALWVRLLRKLQGDVTVHVPHRKRDGYDMRSKFVHEAKEAGAQLILTTDCGIQRCEEVEVAREAGIDVVITDHHEPGPDLPRAAAVVNPHRKDSKYPFPYLAGVGVAFRLGEALVRHLGSPVDSYRRAYSDLAAIGTVADVMPILGDNRVIVKHGLDALRETRKPGLQQLLITSGLKDQKLRSDSIGFRIGPRLNAIGRVDDARLALDILLTSDPKEAARLAYLLECANNDRRAEETRILNDALQQVSGRDLSDTYCLVLSGKDWHSGVIGIVASKVVERTGRPAILIAMDEETGAGRGSARSIRPFHMLDAITDCGDHLVEFGGHSHAAGLSIKLDRFEDFADAMNRFAAERLTEEDFVPVLRADAEVAACTVTVDLLRELEYFEPWGRGNDEPLFISRSLKITDVLKMGSESKHLKLRVRDDEMDPVDAILWNAADLAEHLHAGDRIDLCYRPQLNTYNNYTRVQFMIQDLRPADMEEW
jgi:single-stranded-DNA-specific exonuclease